MRRAGRCLAWSTLAALAALLGGSAIAGPMSVADYSTRVQIEVDFQNMTCSEIDYLWHVFDEMTGRCEPVPPAPPLPPADYGIYDPPRTCPDGLKPTYRLSPDMYNALGPTLRAYLAQGGIPFDVDAENVTELRGHPASSTQFFVVAPINALARELETAAKLKNCHPR